ncbi:MAG: TolC family outer membrane protein [Gammaproteobacteria bacterium]|nr:TolC family outer membrane protein [Gammaproteobacteria bacterium]
MKSKLNLKISTVLGILAFTQVHAGNSSLLDVYHAAQKSDPILKQNIQQHESTKETLNQAYATLYPTIGASASLSENYTTNISGNDYDYSKQNIQLQLDQTVYDARAFLARDMAELKVKSGEGTLEEAYQNLILRVTNAYFDVLLAEDGYQLNQLELKAISRQLEQAQQRYEVGIIAITEVLTAQAGYDQTLANSLVSENEVKIANEQLQEITGDAFNKLARLREDINLTEPVPNDINHWVNLAQENSPIIASLTHKLDSMKKNIELQKSTSYPSLNLNANYQYSDVDGPLVSSARAGSDSSITLKLSVPIYTGGSISSTIRQANNDYLVEAHKLDEKQRSIAKQTRSNFLGVISSIAQVKALKQAVISTTSSLDATEAGYSVGTQTIVDVLNIQRDLYAAKKQLLSAQYNYVKSMISLKYSAGILSEKDLDDSTQLFIN